MVKSLLSVEEYLELERGAEHRSEYVEGRLLAMAGESRTHYQIARNIARTLEDAKAKSQCEVVMEAVKVRVSNERYRYPDVVVSCNPGNHPYFIENPCFIVEVLSEATAETDSSQKLEEYTRIPSLQTYAIVAQKEPRVVVYQREASSWKVEVLSGAGQLEVDCLETALTLEQIYAGIAFS